MNVSIDVVSGGVSVIGSEHRVGGASRPRVGYAGDETGFFVVLFCSLRRRRLKRRSIPGGEKVPVSEIRIRSHTGKDSRLKIVKVRRFRIIPVGEGKQGGRYPHHY